MNNIIAQNKKAYHDYFVEESFEAGIVLVGSEVKSLRAHRGSIKEAHADINEAGIVLHNMHIPEYPQARDNHQPKRPRKLLLHDHEIRKLIGKIKEKGMTLVPLKIYFNKRGYAKVELGLVKGKRKVDKRETIKERDWNREKARVLKDNN